MMLKGFSLVRILLLFFVWSTLGWLGFGCDSSGKEVEGNGNVVEDERSLEDFSAVRIEGTYSIEMEQGAPGVRITTDENLLPLIETVVKGNILRISSTENLNGSDGIKILISYPKLEKIEVGGAAKISHNGVLQANDLDIEVNGAAQLELEAELKKLEVEISGASLVKVSGTARQLEVDMSGAGSLNAYELQVRDASVKLSGVGNAQIYVTDNLQAQLSGVGGIQYRGNPKNIKQDVSGLGAVKPAGSEN